MDAGGEKLVLIPCLNADDSWADVMASLLREAAPQPSDELDGLPPQEPIQGGECSTGQGWCPSGAGSAGEPCEHGAEGGQCHTKIASGECSGHHHKKSGECSSHQHKKKPGINCSAAHLDQW